jgi:hypothetical protein
MENNPSAPFFSEIGKGNRRFLVFLANRKFLKLKTGPGSAKVGRKTMAFR